MFREDEVGTYKNLTFIAVLLCAQLICQVSAFAQQNVDTNTGDLYANQRRAQEFTNNGLRQVELLVNELRKNKRVKIELRQNYEKELRQIDLLKRGRHSWKRDRDLKTLKAKSQIVAQRLSKIDTKIVWLNHKHINAVSELKSAIAHERTLNVLGQRQTMLARIESSHGLRRKMRRKKIMLPSEAIDLSADPDELKEQLALLKQTVDNLVREERVLIAKADGYKKLSRLRRQNSRSQQLSLLDDDRVSRGGGARQESASRGGSANLDADNAEGEGSGGGVESEPTQADDTGGDGSFSGESSGPEEPPTRDDPAATHTDANSFSFGAFSLGSLDESSNILSEVVDSQTRELLKNASRSNNPHTKEKAARRAQVSVKKKEKNCCDFECR